MVFVQIVRAITPATPFQSEVVDAVKKFNNSLHVSFAQAERRIVAEIEKINKEHVNRKILVNKHEISKNTSSLVVENYLSFNLTKTTLWED